MKRSIGARLLGTAVLSLPALVWCGTSQAAVNIDIVTCYEDDDSVSNPNPPGDAPTCPYVDLESLDPLPTDVTNLEGNADPVIRWQSGTGSSATLWLAYSYPHTIRRQSSPPSPWVVSVETHYVKTTDSGSNFTLSNGYYQPTGEKMKLIPLRWDEDPRYANTAYYGVTNSETFNMAKIGNDYWVGIRDKYWHKEGSGKVATSDRLELVMSNTVDNLYNQVTNPDTKHRQLFIGSVGADPDIGAWDDSSCTGSCNGVANFEDNKGTGGSEGTSSSDNWSIVNLTDLGGEDTEDCAMWQEPALYYHTDNRLYLVTQCFAFDEEGIDIQKTGTHVFRSQQNPHSSYVNTWSWEYVGLLFGPTQAVEIKDAGRIESPDDDLTLGATDIALAADGSTLIAITAPNWFDSGAGEASNGHYGCHVIEITDITGPSISTNILNPDLPKNKGRIDTPSLMPDGRGWDGGTHDGANLAILDDDEQEHWLGNSTCSYDSHATGSTVSGIIEAFKYHVTSPYVQKVFLHNSDWRP